MQESGGQSPKREVVMDFSMQLDTSERLGQQNEILAKFLENFRSKPNLEL